MKAFFNKYTEVPDSEWHLVENLMDKRKLKKNEVFLEEGQSCQNEIFIYNGLIRGYYLNDDGEEINISFNAAPDVLTPWFSRNINGISSINYQALEPTVIFEFNAIEFSHLIRTKNWVGVFAYQIVERELKLNVEREKNLLSKNAANKYNFFRKTYPGLETRISQVHVASFLGINPVSLSRMKSQRKP